ncbi:MAG: DUF5069 domain-containing protein [Candidatus Eremiobacteraeota bacterium]|nr:DUF5069 domain-containing protein [Candidatus Eremiobacteraeota bacterium]
MEPLDLTTRPPRAPRETLAGVAFMPRTIDKLRAEMPGGNMGKYLNRSDGLSAVMCKRISVDMDELRAVVASADSEDDVAAWLRERVSPELAAETSAKLATLTMDRLPPEFQERVRKNHPVLAHRPELNTFFDIFDADDAVAFASS